MNNWAIDLANGSYEEKVHFLDQHSDKFVLMDLTCFDPNEFYARFPQLKAVCSTLLSHNRKCELHSEEHYTEANRLLGEQGFMAVRTTIITPGFVVARTIATIINEAYFTFDEKVASASDIDRAMLYGVNYPIGPFAWADGREKTVIRILDLLFKIYKDERYVANQLLREKINISCAGK